MKHTKKIKPWEGEEWKRAIEELEKDARKFRDKLSFRGGSNLASKSFGDGIMLAIAVLKCAIKIDYKEENE